MKDELAFLHTSATHIGRFERLVVDIAPDLRVRHVVAEDLLDQARRVGRVDAALTARVRAAMQEAASTGARVVVCTCSTIGGVAADTDAAGRFVAMRIDQAMAARSVALGPRVLVVAALADTVGPTMALIAGAAESAAAKVGMTPLVVEDAWAAFAAGDMESYIRSIEGAVRRHSAAADVVVLAQASMAAAADALDDLAIEVLSSPELGVRAAVSALRELKSLKGC